MEKIFVPILRSKKFAQLNIVKHLSEFRFFDLVEDRLIPYIEFKSKDSNNSMNKYLDVLSDKKYFYELYIENNNISINDYLSAVVKTNYTPKAIPSIKLSYDSIMEYVNEIKETICMLHKQNLNVALRVVNYRNLENIINVINFLTEKDFLILDNEDSGMETKLLIANYNKIVSIIKPKILFFSIERSQKAARLYENEKYTNLCNYNLIDYLKKNPELTYDGFGSYCGAKNDNNEIRNNVPVEGIFFEYSYLKNKFFVTKTINRNIISLAYTPLTEYFSSIINEKNEIGSPLYHLKEVNGYALKRLKQIISYHQEKNKNSTAWNYVEITIENYIEQIIKFYLLEK